VLFCAFYALPFRKEVFKTAQGQRSDPSVRFLPIVDTVYAQKTKSVNTAALGLL
jgi:hypothetical protein